MGRRVIGGGRPVVCTMLTIVAMHASRCDDAFGAFRRRLQSAGKPLKAALVATARKLLVTLNAMMTTSADHRRTASS